MMYGILLNLTMAHCEALQGRHLSLNFLFCMNWELFPPNLPFSSWPLPKTTLHIHIFYCILQRRIHLEQLKLHE